MFMHGSLMHIVGNMVFLWVFGDNVEDRFGHVWFLIFYLGTGLVADAAHIFFNSDSLVPTVGASGAISGVLGAYIVMFHRNRVRVLMGYWVTEVPAWMMIGLWAAMQFLYTYVDVASADTAQTGGVAYAAHAGGFLAGVVLAMIARGMGAGRAPRERVSGRRARR
jgi:membrane associated rhomboid family serine protease